MENHNNEEINEFGQERNESDNDEMNFEKYDKHSVKPTKEQLEQDSLIFNQTLNSISNLTKTTTTTTTTTTKSNSNNNNTTSNIIYNDDNTTTREINSAISITTINKTNQPFDDISDDDDDEYIKNKKKEIENIKPHFSSDDEMIKFNISDLKLFIEKLEQSNIDLALEYQDDPDPIYLESIKENIDVIDKKKK
ncbi:hypothetical protein ACTFIZ_012637 [Dictyostelium cf. discoideum]